MRAWPVFVLLLAAAACGGDAPTARPAAKAGTWYPDDPAVLRKDIEGYFEQAPKAALPGPPVAVIAPHAGYQFSGRCAGAVYAHLRGRDIRRVMVLAPTHHVRMHGGSIPAVDFYETPLGRIPLDREACEAILESPLVKTVPAAHRQEHSLELQLPFLQTALKEFTLIPVVLGGLDAKEQRQLAHLLRDYLDAHTLVVASTDFTHYGRGFGYVPFTENVRENIEKLDRGALAHVLGRDAEGFRQYVAKTGATICGRTPVAVLLEMLPPDCRGKLIQYYMSGDLEGDYGHTVSYAAAAFTIGPGEVSAAGRKRLLEIARATLRATAAGEKPPDFDVDGEELQARRGVFVTYKIEGRLRGCIGRFEADLALWKAVREMAVASARHDPRFKPVTEREEPKIDIEISILSPMTRIEDPLNFIPGVHGLTIRSGRRSGTYLPQVAAEQGWDKRTFLSHLCRHKIGLSADAWKDKDTEVSIYSAQVFGDKRP